MANENLPLDVDPGKGPKEEDLKSDGKGGSDMEIVVSGEANETRSTALIKKYQEMADMRRDYEDIDIRDCIPTLDEMVKDDMMYEILENAANGNTEQEVLSTAYYTEEPPKTELGYHPELNTFIYKIGSMTIKQEDIDLNKIDGDTFRVPLSSIIEPGNPSFTLNNGDSYESFKDYCYSKGLVNKNDSEEKQYLQIRLVGVDSPEIPHYDIQMMKESDIVQMTLSEARKKKAIMNKYKYNNGTASDRTDSGKIDFYKVKNSSGGYTYHEILGNDGGYVKNKKSGYVYKKIVIKDESSKESLAGGYKAKQNLIDLVSAGNIYIMLDVNGTVAKKTSGKYKLYYNHWWCAADAIKDMIDQWCDYSNETALTKLTYSPFGTDGYGRFLGSVYAPKEGLYTNIAKYNIADDETKSTVNTNTNSPEMDQAGGDLSSAFELYNYHKNNQIWLDSFGEMTKESYKARLEFHKEVTGIDFSKVRNCSMMIGDTFLLIPPQNIRSLSSIEYEKVSVMRGKGSMVKNNTNRDMFLEVDLFFYNGDGVNGIPKDVTLPNGQQVTYYMNGLRSLIAQFKVAPYLPIENQFINDVLNIEAVSLVNLNVSTVEGMPRLLRATLTMRDFNYRIYMPDIPIDYSSNQTSEITEMNPIFAKCFNWEVFRFYYQRMISYGNKLKDFEYDSPQYRREFYGRKEALQPVYFCEKDGFGSSDISFYTPDENWLKAALALKKDRDYNGQSPIKVELTEVGKDFFKRVGALSSDLMVNGTYAQRIADSCEVMIKGIPSLTGKVKNDNVLETGKSVVQPMKDASGSSSVKPESSSNVTIPNKIEDMFKGYTKLDVSGGNLSGQRQPNAVVDIGYGNRQYYGFTNANGQLVKVVAKKITVQDDDKESVNKDGRYYDDQANVPGTEREDLDKGHVIADSLGGVANAYNITPQNATLNRTGQQSKIEKEIRDAGGCTDFVAVMTYPNAETQIPSHYSYTYTINGKKKTTDFANEEPGTKSYDKNNLLSDLLNGVSDKITSCGVLSYISTDEVYDQKEKQITWKQYFSLSSKLSSNDIQCIRETLRDLTGQPFNDVLPSNQLVVTITANTDGKKIDPAMSVSCTEIDAMAKYNGGVEASEDVSSYDYLEPANMQFIPYLENVEVQQLSFTLSNNFSDITLKIMDGFAPQYMGSSDITIDVNIITTNVNVVSMLNVLPAHASNIGKLYRKILSCWPIKVRNHYLQMAGVNEVLIDLVEIQTMEGYPGTFEIRLRMTSVDRTMRNKETLKQLESDEISSKKATASMFTYWDLDNVLSSAELYPDLDLPSIKELNEYGFQFIRYKNTKQSYPDPDFYLTYSWPYTAYIIKKNLKDVFYNSIFHDGDKEKSELFDDTSYEFFDHMGVTMYQKLDPKTALTETKNSEGKTQNDRADTFDEVMNIIDEGATENIKKSDREAAREIEENDCSNLSSLLVYLTACDVQQGWTIKPGFTAPVVINELNLDVEKLYCSGIPHDEATVDEIHNAYAQDVFDLRAETIKAIDAYLSEPIDYDLYDISSQDLKDKVVTNEAVEYLAKKLNIGSEAALKLMSSSSAEGYGGVISKVVERFAAEEKGKKIIQLLNPFETEFTIKEEGFFKKTFNLKDDYDGQPDYEDYDDVRTLNYMAGFLYSAAKCITAEKTTDSDTKEVLWEPRQYYIDGLGKIKEDSTGEKVPNCLIESNGKTARRAESLKEALEQGVQWGMFQIKIHKAHELQEMLQPKSRVTYLSKEDMPMYKDPETGKERWHPGFIDPYYNIAGYRSKKGKEYIEKIATNEGINTIAFIRVMLMHLRRMIIDGLIFSEIDVIAKDYENIEETIAIEPNKEDYEEALQEGITDYNENETLLEKFFSSGTNLDELSAITASSEREQVNAVEDAVGDEDMAGTIMAILKDLPQTYSRSFCARVVLPVLMAVVEGGESFNSMLVNYQLNDLNNLTVGTVTNTTDENLTVIGKFCKAMQKTGVLDFDDSDTAAETTSDSQKLWNYIMREAYTKLSDDAQAYTLHSYYDMLINDKRGRLVRAFPTYYIVFIDEGRKIGSWKLFDNFYNMSSISEITVSKSRKIPADTCSFVMSNMYTSYAATYDTTTKQQYVDVYGLRDVFNSIFCPESYFLKEDSLRRRKENLETVVLQPGVRIHVRMGYGADAGRLPVAFNGKIAEIDVGDVVQVIAQGDGSELCNPLNTLGDMDAVSLTESQSWTTMFKDLRGSMKRGGESPRNLLSKLLTAKYGGVFKTVARELFADRFYGDNPFGIYHFGDNRFNYIFSEGETVQNLYEVCDATLLKGSNELYASRENNMSTPTINTSIQDKTLWDILQLCANSGIGYMGAVRDFGMRSTVCLCKPNHYYAFAYKKIDDENGQTDGKIVERRKPFQQFHYYDSYTDIVYNSIKASERNMKTNAIGIWESTDVFWGKSQATVGPIYLDMNIYPEHQKSMTVDTTLVSDGEGGLELNPLTHFSEKWASDANDNKVNKALAERVTTNVLRESVSNMYCGELCVLGDLSIKPFDRFYVNDTYEDMKGHMEVEGVVYSMNSATGFTTTIYPDTIVRMAEDAHEAAVRIVDGAMIGSFGVAITGRLMGISTLARMDTALLRVLQRGITLLSTPADEMAVGVLGKFFAGTRFVGAKDAAVAALEAGVSVTSIATTIALAAGIYVCVNNVKAWFGSFLRHINALSVYPIFKNGRPLIAGMAGHKGSVMGYEYTETDAEDSIQGLITGCVEWLNKGNDKFEKILPFEFGDILMSMFTRKVQDENGNNISEYELVKRQWARTLPLEGISDPTQPDDEGKMSMEEFMQMLYGSATTEFGARNQMTPELRTKWRIPSLAVSKDDMLADRVYKKYHIEGVSSPKGLATNDKVLALYPIEDELEIKQAVVKGSHPVVKQLEIAHARGNMKVQMPFESGNRIIKLFTEKSGDNYIYDLPMLQEDALKILKFILNDQALKNKNVAFLSGARINDQKTWKSTGFAFVIDSSDKSALEDAIKNIMDSTKSLTKDAAPIFEYKAASEGFLIIVYAPIETYNIGSASSTSRESNGEEYDSPEKDPGSTDESGEVKAPEQAGLVFPGDSLTDQDIHVGDKVTVSDPGYVFTTYDKYLENRNINTDYWKNKDNESDRPKKNAKYTLSYINYDDMDKGKILCIISDSDGKYFIMDKRGLKK